MLPILNLPTRREINTPVPIEFRSHSVIFPASSATTVSAAALPLRTRRLRQRAERWATRRRIFAELIAQHQRAGYHISPATWQRLREEASQRADVVTTAMS